MTMTESRPIGVSLDAPVQREELTLAEAIMAEAGCSKSKAKQLVNFLTKMVTHGRKYEYCPYHLNIRQLHPLTGVHAVLDVIMPDDTVATPGSAHDRLNRELLDPARGELAFVHSKAFGIVEDCTVTLAVMQFG